MAREKFLICVYEETTYTVFQIRRADSKDIVISTDSIEKLKKIIRNHEALVEILNQERIIQLHLILKGGQNINGIRELTAQEISEVNSEVS